MKIIFRNFTREASLGDGKNCRTGYYEHINIGQSGVFNNRGREGNSLHDKK